MSGTSCADCPVRDDAGLRRLGIRVGEGDYIVALAGNPNTGKSTVFNTLTGLRQHTGNWPGKTVTRAEGAFAFRGKRYRLVDLPGTYSLLATSTDEEVARDAILFGKPDVTVIVVDATHLERNLNLVLQVLEITDRAVVCLNLMDEAQRNRIEIDPRRLARDLGVPVVATTARRREGIDELLTAIDEVATGTFRGKPRRVPLTDKRVIGAVSELVTLLEANLSGVPNARWLALRLLDGDRQVISAIGNGDWRPDDEKSDAVLETAERLRRTVTDGFHDTLTEDLYAEATRIAQRSVQKGDGSRAFDLDRAIDSVVTSRVWGFPLMFILFALVFWITVSGANVPSALLASVLIDRGIPLLHALAAMIGLPGLPAGLLIDGCYLSTAWVVSVMLPPMAIFFPLFTLLEDFGYLPRVAFNLDRSFRNSGAHGKQALTMMMGFGCNAAGVVAARVIDSPRERLIAILTNNFALCNGRWPTQILSATLFIGSLVPPYLAGLVSAAAVVAVALTGIVLSLGVSRVLSRTLLRGEVSAFSLELPPYRPPRILRTIYTSLIDRTVFVLWRAVLFALPAGAVIWIVSNVQIAGSPVASYIVGFLDPFGFLIGLNGVILLAYIVAIPANEIVIPTILMLTVLLNGIGGIGSGAGVMFELDSLSDTHAIFTAGGWTLLTAINLMVFSLIHNPCSTTLYTIYRETGSRRWTAIAALLPLGMGFGITFFIAQVWRIVAGIL